MDWAIPGGLDWAASGLAAHAGGWSLVLARVVGLCLTAPGLAVPGLSWRFRLGLASVLGVILVPVIGERATAPPDWPGVAWSGLGEVLTGAMLGMAAGLIVAGARAAGDLVAAQAGLSTTTLFDPESGEEMTPLGRLYELVAMAAFLALGGPMALVRALADTYTAIPVGELLVSQQSATFAFSQVGQALELALRVAAPPAVALIMAGIALGWLSRAAPSVPFLVLALPIRAVLGIVLVSLSLATLLLLLAGAWEGLLGLG
jgi:flagellar biosynthesis protein FliR